MTADQDANDVDRSLVHTSASHHHVHVGGHPTSILPSCRLPCPYTEWGMYKAIIGQVPCPCRNRKHDDKVQQ